MRQHHQGPERLFCARRRISAWASGQRRFRGVAGRPRAVGSRSRPRQNTCRTTRMAWLLRQDTCRTTRMARLLRQDTCRTTRMARLLRQDAMCSLRQVSWRGIGGILVVQKATFASKHGCLVVRQARFETNHGSLVVRLAALVAHNACRIVPRPPPTPGLKGVSEWRTTLRSCALVILSCPARVS